MAGGSDAPHLIDIHGCALRVELAEVLPIIPNAASQLHHTLPCQESALLFPQQSNPTSRSASFFTRVCELWPGFRLQGQHNACIPSPEEAVPTASGFTWQQSTGYTLRSGERCSLPARALRRVVFPEPGGPSSRVILPCRPADTPSGGGAAAGRKGVCPAADTKRPGIGLACQLNGLSSRT